MTAVLNPPDSTTHVTDPEGNPAAGPGPEPLTVIKLRPEQVAQHPDI